MPDASKSPTLDDVWERLARALFGKGWSNHQTQTTELKNEDEKATESSVAHLCWASDGKPTKQM